jgi:hypothetical protein
VAGTLLKLTVCRGDDRRGCSSVGARLAQLLPDHARRSARAGARAGPLRRSTGRRAADARGGVQGRRAEVERGAILAERGRGGGLGWRASGPSSPSMAAEAASAVALVRRGQRNRPWRGSVWRRRRKRGVFCYYKTVNIGNRQYDIPKLTPIIICILETQIGVCLSRTVFISAASSRYL